MDPVLILLPTQTSPKPLHNFHSYIFERKIQEEEEEEDISCYPVKEVRSFRVLTCRASGLREAPSLSVPFVLSFSSSFASASIEVGILAH